MSNSLHSALVEKAVRIAAVSHRDQLRKATDVPYFAHPAAVALILARCGFDDDSVLAAAFLHDVVEDTDVSIDRLRVDFPPAVIDIVECLSEQKTDETGAKRPWKDRKTDHLDVIRKASPESKAVALADKLHNLSSMRIDFDEQGESLWTRFNATKQEILWYHDAMIEAASHDDPRIRRLQSECRSVLEELR